MAGPEAEFLFLHGYQHHRVEGHWMRWLQAELNGRGRAVAYPQFPDPDQPKLPAWLAELDRQLAAHPGCTVVAHSLGAVLWLHAAGRGTDVRRSLLIAPPSPTVIADIPEIAGFALPGVDPVTVAALARQRALLLGSDGDPYCPEGAAQAYGRPYGLPTEIVPGGAHLDLAAGYGPWPGMLAWCLDPDSGPHFA